MENKNIIYVSKKYPYTTIMTTEFYEHKHSFWEFVLCVNGQGCHFVNGIKYSIKQGDLLIMKPDNTHDYKIDLESNYTHHDFYVTRNDMKSACDNLKVKIYEKLIKNSEPLLISLDENTTKSLESKMTKLNSLQLNSVFESLSNVLYNSLLHQFCGLIIEDQVSKMINVPDWLSNLLTTMSKPEFITGSFDEIIQTTNFSHGHLCRLFKKHMNDTLINYFTKLKLDYSTVLLKNKNMNILDISTQIGYESVSHYIHVFKKYYGVTPKKYRKELLNI